MTEIDYGNIFMSPFDALFVFAPPPPMKIGSATLDSSKN